MNIGSVHRSCQVVYGVFLSRRVKYKLGRLVLVGGWGSLISQGVVKASGTVPLIRY